MVQHPTRDSAETATLGRRFGALLIDWLLCVFASGAVASAREHPWAAPAALVLEYAFFVGLFGQTPGMFVARIRCVSVDGGGPIGIPRAFLRGLLLALVVPALIMGEHRRGLHDRAVGSVVVEAAPR